MSFTGWHFQILIAIVLVILFSQALAASPSHYCYYANKDIKIDGRANEKAWKDVPPVELRSRIEAWKSEPAADMKIIWNNSGFYIFTQRASKDSNLSMVLDPLAEGRDYVELVFDLQKNTCKLFTGDSQTSRTEQSLNLRSIKSVCKKGEPGISYEAFIPWDIIANVKPGIQAPKADEVWRCILKYEDRNLFKTAYWPVLSPSDDHNLSRAGYIIFSDHKAQYSKTPARNKLEWKMVWLWTMADKSDEYLVSAAKNLGFNAISVRSREMVEECHKQGMLAYGAMWMGNGNNKFTQTIGADEDTPRTWPEGKIVDIYQYGGEPLLGGDIFREGDCWCLDKPEAFDYAKECVDAVIANGCDGIAFDAFGYTNYYACKCPETLAKLDEYKVKHPELSGQQAVYKYSEECLVGFYTRLAEYAKSRKPDIRLTSHIYPVFAPNPLYGSKLPVEWCGQTTAWFFKPYWSLEKVERYAYEIAQTGSNGAPFVAVYTLPPYDMHTKGADRVRKELEMVQKSGARALQMAELGHILNNPDIAEVVRKALKEQSE